MIFFKFIFFVIFSFILFKRAESYVYPVWGHAYDRHDKLVESAEGDATVTEFIITNFLIPMKDGFCNICANFLEVYDCVLANVEYLGENSPPETRSYVERILEYVGLYNSQDFSIPPSCSYYSILVVTISTMLFMGLIFVTKKLVDYVKEEEKIFPQMLYDYQNKCPCYEKQ